MRKIDNIKECIASMTLEDKAKLVNGGNFFGSNSIEKLGIDRIQFLDGGTGINYEQLFGDITQLNSWKELLPEVEARDIVGSKLLSNVIKNYYSRENLNDSELALCEWIEEKVSAKLDGEDYSPACYPPGILLGATFNKNVVFKVGEALGLEALLYGIDVLLGTPNVNIHRDPLNGRLFEGYSEDPLLVSTLAPELVKGVQQYNVAANVKHYAANNQETNRMGINELISRRALEEIYLPGFRACVCDGNVKTVMTAYNKINGVACTENKFLIEEKLRKEWGFDGFVVSDWNAVYDDAMALAAGNDLAMPGPRSSKEIIDAVNDGIIDEQCLDDSVERILRTINWMAGKDIVEIDTEIVRVRSDEAAYESACEGIVLLENEILPLDSSYEVVLAGSGARHIMMCGQGSAGITTDRQVELVEYLPKYVDIDKIYFYDEIEDFDSFCETHSKVVTIMISSVSGMEGNDRKTLSLPAEDIELLDKLSNDVVLVLNSCGPVDLYNINRSNLKAVIAIFFPGMGGARALTDILFGKVNPSGKLPITFPKEYRDTPTYINFPGDGYTVNYGEGIYVGYRYYDKKQIEPMYHFGYGLSYTEFAEKLLAVNVEKKKINIKVEVANIGRKAGAQVVQLYISDVESTLSKPYKELKAFEKVYLEAGEKKIVDFSIPFDSLASFDENYSKMIVEEGYYDVILATSSDMKDVFGCERVYIDVESPYNYGSASTIKVVYENPELKRIIVDIWNNYGLDVGSLEGCYQYTSTATIREIIEHVEDISFSRIMSIATEIDKEFKKVKKR